MKVKVNDFRQCDFCQVETTAPLLFIEIDGFLLDVCPPCWKTQFSPEASLNRHNTIMSKRGEEE